ncbi:MAG: hypothetical protein AAF960_11660 [Bacteroidota bacterium]
MKKQVQLIVIGLLTIISSTFAQVSEEEKAMSLGVNNAILVNIPETTTKIAEKVWKDYVKQFKGKTKKNRKAEEWKTTNGQIMAINGDAPISFFAKIQAINEDVELALWLPTEEGYVSSTSNPEGYEEAKKILNAYALEVKIETVKQELGGEEKTLGGLEKDLKKLKKENEGYHKDIKNAEQDIDDSENGLIRNAEDQKEAVRKVRMAEDIFAVEKDSLEILISEASSKAERKGLKKTMKAEERKVKDAKNEQKRFEREENKLRKTIANAKRTIEESKKKIAQNEIDQKNKVEAIGDQKEVVRAVEGRLKELYSQR